MHTNTLNGSSKNNRASQNNTSLSMTVCMVLKANSTILSSQNFITLKWHSTSSTKNKQLTRSTNLFQCYTVNQKKIMIITETRMAIHAYHSTTRIFSGTKEK